jgi:hypothetical protein
MNVSVCSSATCAFALLQYSAAIAADTNVVTEDENFQHIHGIEGRPLAAVLAFLRVEGIKPLLIVMMVNDVGDVAFGAILFDPTPKVLGEEVLLILIVSDEFER